MCRWVTAVSASTGSTRLDAVTLVASTTTESFGTNTTRVTSVRRRSRCAVGVRSRFLLRAGMV